MRSAIAVDDAELTAEQNALPDARLGDFRSLLTAEMKMTGVEFMKAGREAMR